MGNGPSFSRKKSKAIIFADNGLQTKSDSHILKNKQGESGGTDPEGLLSTKDFSDSSIILEEKGEDVTTSSDNTTVFIHQQASKGRKGESNHDYNMTNYRSSGSNRSGPSSSENPKTPSFLDENIRLWESNSNFWTRSNEEMKPTISNESCFNLPKTTQSIMITPSFSVRRRELQKTK